MSRRPLLETISSCGILASWTRLRFPGNRKGQKMKEEKTLKQTIKCNRSKRYKPEKRNVALYNGNGFFPFSSSDSQTLPKRKIAQEPEKKMEFSGGVGEMCG